MYSFYISPWWIHESLWSQRLVPRGTREEGTVSAEILRVKKRNWNAKKFVDSERKVSKIGFWTLTENFELLHVSVLETILCKTNSIEKSGAKISKNFDVLLRMIQSTHRIFDSFWTNYIHRNCFSVSRSGIVSTKGVKWYINYFKKGLLDFQKITNFVLVITGCSCGVLQVRFLLRCVC